MVMNEKFVSTFSRSGPWALLSAGLIVWGLVEITPILRAVPALKAEHAEMRAELNRSMDEQLRMARRTAYLSWRNCINTARNREQQLACGEWE